ncbi:MAG: PA14 domain-containing protein, partial [Planctomycetes bacterium]|nr:PA14 domain-containing protein [Planctomycetota bacterium]
MNRLRFLLVALAIGGISAVASASVFTEDFESYPVGNLHGTNGWKGWDNAAGATGKVSTAFAHSGTKSVEILSASDFVHEFKLAGGKYTFSIWQYIPSGGTGISYFILLNTYADAGTDDWSIQTQYNLATGAITCWHGGIGGATEILFDQWVEIKLLINLDKNAFEEYYGGTLIAFGQWDDNTHGTLQAVDLFGNGASSIYYDDLQIDTYQILKAQSPNPADGAAGVGVPVLQWTVGDTAMFHDVYLGKTAELTDADKVASRLPFPMYYHIPGLEPGTTYYWRVDEIEVAGATHTGDVWSFTATPKTAYKPSPWDGAKWVDAKPQLSWSAGITAQSHDVYFGLNQDEVAAGTGGTSKGNQLTPDYQPDTLQANTTYYWRIDEVQGDGTKQTGPVWSFTTVGPGGGVIAQYFNGMGVSGFPILTQTENSIDHNWGSNEVAAKVSDSISARWTAVLEAPGFETFTFITTSDDGVRLFLDGRRIINNWTDHGTTDNRAQVNLVAGQTYRIVMEYYENTGGAVAQLSWESPTIARQIIPAGPLQLPYRAATPYPSNGAVDVPQNAALSWIGGDKTAKHQIYFGDNQEAVANGTAAVTSQARDKNSFDPGGLEWNKTYYWRVDEVNDAASDSPWKGNVWSFTTANFIVVDDFESYTDEQGNSIFEIWVDGWTNNTGSRV